eukprot:CAMPEP_0181344528 /NCGR_PEP_ID=MMETSP1101-20121128/32223_1 /TAXON_ID=46948 /ORGANISM="Rhodomonas abbreviata, Strain Caron Lab Isolate" /LENGTH=32 /DNA_ID= /DNA_START= /DNA_END= /DNA_ORIENTATION=
MGGKDPTNVRSLAEEESAGNAVANHLATKILG